VKKPILITGGTKRLGAAIARALHAAGHPVLLHARSPSAEGDQLAADLQTRIIYADLADANAIPGIIEQAGPLSGLVNNASHFVFDNPSTTTADNIADHLGPNLIAPVLLSRAFAAQKNPGVIINMLDQKLTNLNPDFFAYTLTKAALAAATEMMAQAFASHSIRVCGIAPGITLPAPKMSAESFQRAWAANPLGRGATPADIGRAAVFIVTTPSLTGTTITVDSGEHLTHNPRDVAFLVPE
jgi:NAD(P)-dependent dehydrogenase (short-subunit alcohol dehydrogenase family)